MNRNKPFYHKTILAFLGTVVITSGIQYFTVPAKKPLSNVQAAPKSQEEGEEIVDDDIIWVEDAEAEYEDFDTEYHIEESEDGLYLKNREEETASGWFIKFKNDFLPLGSLQDLGLYKIKSFKILFANAEGKIAADQVKKGFYFNGNGFLREANGLYRMKGKYYLLKDGRLQTEEQQYQQVKYLMRLDGSVSGYQWKRTMYSPEGEKLSDIAYRDLQTRTYAREIIRQITNKTMLQEEKLQTCFQWVIKNYSYVEVGCMGEKGWTSKSGMSLLKSRIGDCRCLAAGFAYLASELGYEDTYICQDSQNKFSGSHCWASVDGKYYDPLFYNSRRPTRYLDVFNGSTPEEYHKKTHCNAYQKFKPGE